MSDKPIESKVPKAPPKVKGPNTERYEFTVAGKYNALGLPVVPHTIVKVTDAGKGKLEWKLIGQQLVGSRRFTPPVVVEYITDAEHARWHKAEIDAAAKEAAKK